MNNIVVWTFGDLLFIAGVIAFIIIFGVASFIDWLNRLKSKWSNKNVSRN